MEVLILILLLVFVFSSKNKKGKGGRAAAKPGFAESAAKQAPRAAARPARAEAGRRLRPVKVAGQASPVFMARPEAADFEDEEGCVGGSMEHDHAEGESREEHRRHVEAVISREAEDTRAAQAAAELSEMNLQRLRQAVVMAEILDRPKALQMKRCGRRSA